MDNTASQMSYHHNGNLYTYEKGSLYWNGPWYAGNRLHMVSHLWNLSRGHWLYKKTVRKAVRNISVRYGHFATTRKCFIAFRSSVTKLLTSRRRYFIRIYISCLLPLIHIHASVVCGFYVLRSIGGKHNLGKITVRPVPILLTWNNSNPSMDK